MISAVRPWSRYLILISAIMAFYYQSIFHPLSRFDDLFIVEHYGNHNLSLLDIITPGTSFYYRPLINISYWLDNVLWSLDPSFMHLENILVHTINCVLVYAISSRLFFLSKNRYLPFFSSILFGIHPVNSEPVNWISGRTDLYACLFVLFATYSLIRAIQDQSTILSIASFSIAFLGTLAKENAVMFIPEALLLAYCWPTAPVMKSSFKAWRTRSIFVPAIVLACVGMGVILSAYALRRGDNSISMLMGGGRNDFALNILKGIGFYLKKMYLPTPLNIAITDVATWYAMLGIICVAFIWLGIRHLNIPIGFLLCGALFTLPALAVAVAPLAWTQYGERYLYIPSAFAIIGSIELTYQIMTKRKLSKLFIPFCSVVAVCAGFITFQRNILWGDNLAFVEDMVKKSPGFGVARNEYGVLLLKEMRHLEAEHQFRLAVLLTADKDVKRVVRNNLIGVQLYGKSPEECYSFLLQEMGSKILGDVEPLKMIYRCEEALYGRASTAERKGLIVGEMLETNEQLFVKTGDPHYFYRSGQLLLSIGNKSNAAEYFRKAYEKSAPDAFYRESARSLADKLGG